jgi:hypothetical protein
MTRLPSTAPLTYFDVPEGVCPEATHDFYRDPVLREERVNEPNYGCKAVQTNFEFLGRRSLLMRQCMQELMQVGLTPCIRTLSALCSALCCSSLHPLSGSSQPPRSPVPPRHPPLPPPPLPPAHAHLP